MKISRLFASACCALALLLPSHSRAQSYPPVWTSGSTYVAGDIVQYGGNWFRALKAVAPSTNSPSINYTNWELNFVRSNTTLIVGAGGAFPNLVFAWQYARNARIADAAYLHFSLADGLTEKFTAPFSLDHGSGALISIIADGNGTQVLNFTGCNGFNIDSGHSFGVISNVTFNGQAGYIGISAEGDADISNIEGIWMNGFGTGFFVYQGGAVSVTGSTAISCPNFAVADFAGTIFLASGVYVHPAAQSSGIGLYANRNATIIAEGCDIGTSTIGYSTDVWAENGAMIDVNHGDISSATLTGLAADTGGRIEFEDGYAANTGYDALAVQSGTINAVGATFNDKTKTGMGDGSYIWT